MCPSHYLVPNYLTITPHIFEFFLNCLLFTSHYHIILSITFSQSSLQRGCIHGCSVYVSQQGMGRCLVQHIAAMQTIR